MRSCRIYLNITKQNIFASSLTNLILRFFPGWAVRAEEVFFVQIAEFDLFGLGIAAHLVRVRDSAERLDVNPTQQIHAGVMLRQKLTEVLQLDSVGRELIQAHVAELLFDAI